MNREKTAFEKDTCAIEKSAQEEIEKILKNYYNKNYHNESILVGLCSALLYHVVGTLIYSSFLPENLDKESYLQEHSSQCFKMFSFYLKNMYILKREERKKSRVENDHEEMDALKKEIEELKKENISQKIEIETAICKREDKLARKAKAQAKKNKPENLEDNFSTE